MNEKNKIEVTDCGHTDGIKKFEEILQGLYCIDVLNYVPVVNAYNQKGY